MGHFRAGLGDYLDRVFFLKESFVILKSRKPFARIDPATPKTKTDKQVDALQIRKEIADILGMAHYGKANLLVLRRGKPVAVISGYSASKDKS